MMGELSLSGTPENKSKKKWVNLQNEELRGILSSIPGGLGAYQYDGECTTPVFHNPVSYIIMGYSPEHTRQVEREMAYLGVHSDDTPVLNGHVQKALQDNGRLEYICHLWNDECQGYRWLHTTGVAKPWKNGKKLLHNIHDDVSEQH